MADQAAPPGASGSPIIGGGGGQSPTGGDAWARVRAEARSRRVLLQLADDAEAETAVRAALKNLGYRVKYLPPGDSILSGAQAMLDVELRRIWVRNDVPADQRRVLLGHEIAHFYLHHDDTETTEEDGCSCYHGDVEAESGGMTGGDTLVGYGPRQRRETEANVFAREFLLPAPTARRLFFEKQLEAAQIAKRIGVPVGVVYAQLADALTTGNPAAASVAPTAPPSPPSLSTVSIDPSQEEAARSVRGPLLVGAGPGTGKTRTLTARVLFLTRELGIRPENLLALTFSRKAAEEMRERIGAVAPDIARRAAICTFHAYGLDLLRRYWREAGLPPQPVLLSMADTLALLERRAGNLPLEVLRYLHDPAFPLPDILRTIGRAKEEMLTPEAFAARAEAQGDDRLIEVARVYALYEDLIRDKGALDFSDLVYKALRLLEENETVRRAEQERWRHVLVDEYQDVNRAGARMVQLLGGTDGTGLWFVGDLRQSIYRFRGSSPENVARFEEDFPGGRRTELAVNYRSRPTLVALFGSSCGEGAQTWRAARHTGEAVTVEGEAASPAKALAVPAILAVAPDEEVQAGAIATRIHAFHDQGRRFSDIALLCRTRGQANRLRSDLALRGIPVAGGDGGENDLLLSPDVKDLLALLARASEPHGPAKHRFPELPTGIPTAATDAYDFWTQTLWGAAGWARRITDPAAVAQLLNLARTFRERASVVLEPDDDPRRAFLSHIRRLAKLGIDLGRTSPESIGEDTPDLGVRVLTAHAAKGLEFPVVFLPNLSVGKFPARPGPSLLPSLPFEEEEAGPTATNDSTEEARLFFVALTRARDHLILSRAERYNNRIAAPSPLLACLTEAERAGLLRRESWEKGSAYAAGANVPLDPVAPPAQGKAVDTRSAEYLAPGSAISPAGDLPGKSPAGEIADPQPGTPHSSLLPPHDVQTKSSGTLAPAGQAKEESPAPIEAGDAELYLRCSKRYYYERVANLAASERSAYGAFKRAVARALAEDDPTAAFAAHWNEHGPDAAHPLHEMYRETGEALVARGATSAGTPAPPLPQQRRRRGGEASSENAPEPPALSLRLEHGTVVVRPDAATPDLSIVELHSFRRPPKDDKAPVKQAPSEMRLSLLQEAAGESATVRVRYVQGDIVLPAKDTRRQREKHLAAYDRALRGLQLRMYEPAPADTSDCPNCPYLFICPVE